MKKYLFLAVAACLGLTSCEDVPAPYEIFADGSISGGSGTDTGLGLPYSSANLNSGWTVVTLQGTPWSLGSSYAKATGYNSGTTTPSESWLVSPAINTTNDTQAAHITLEHVIAYVKSDCPLTNHTAWITNEFDGNDVNASSWTQLDYHPVERTNTSSWDFYAADEIAIPSAFVGQTVYVAFKFVCESNSTTWELKNFNLLAGEAAPPTDKPGVPDVPVTGAGSKAEPYNVASAQSASGNAWVEGYIVGYVEGQTYASGATFALPGEAQTEVILADAANVTDAAACIPVQLPAGDIRSALDLFANPTMLGQKVKLYGSLEKYFGVNGLKSTSCAIVGDKVIGKDPEATEPDQPVGDVKGTGTATDPYNVAGVISYTNALAADVNSTSEIYFKGIVSSVKEISPVGSYNNATFYISDDGTTANQFYIFRCLGLNKADIPSADLVKVGDEVLICGKVVNYKGNTPETVQKEAWIVSINGQGGGETPDNPDTPVDPTPDTPSDPSQLVLNGDFEAWTNGLPDHWKSASSAGNAKLAQSTQAHGGSYSVQVNGTTANQRLAYEETVYAPGTYNVKFYAKALGGATSDYGPQCRPGYVPVTDGKVGSYVYQEGYVTLSETDWTEVNYTFTLTEQTTLCLVVMNAKNSGNILIDDYSISKQ